jgi:23S rRNA (uracil1939-C5)-methyltransferase
MKNSCSARSAEAEPAEIVLDIRALGAQGDGVARFEGREVFAPFTLPGERVRARLLGERAELIEVEAPSPGRAPPICPHFGLCGGCALQHFEADAYAAWKRDLVRGELAKAGIEAEVEPIRAAPIPARRRATFTARRSGGLTELGYLARRSDRLTGLSHCPVLTPRLSALLPGLRGFADKLLAEGQEARFAVTEAENGLDLTAEGQAIPKARRAVLPEDLQHLGFIRASWNGTILFQRETPFVRFGRASVDLPSGAFLQAVAQVEEDMAELARAWLKPMAKRGPFCDLFAGLGAFTFPLAEMGAVTAYEADERAITALNEAARRAAGLKPVSAVRRDLFRHALGFQELNRFSGAILDPPRQGAEAQCRQLARSNLRRIIYVSCNLATFARDAAILTEGGYSLVRAVPFDQFRFTAQVEIVGLFERRR